MIKSIGDKSDQIIADILKLHHPEPGQGIDVDLTYSIGAFYKSGLVQEPKLKLDLIPKDIDVYAGNFENIKLEDCSVNCVMMDPPFVTRNKIKKDSGIIVNRFGSYPYIEDLQLSYRKAINECFRILNKKGILIFKCQDLTYYHKQHLIHIFVHDEALNAGFYPKDLFILKARSVVLRSGIKNQQHARKAHSYFWVFQKSKKRAKYI